MLQQAQAGDLCMAGLDMRSHIPHPAGAKELIWSKPTGGYKLLKVWQHSAIRCGVTSLIVRNTRCCTESAAV